MTKVVETNKGFRIVATTRKEQAALSMMFQSVSRNATFKIENSCGDMAHTEWVEFDYAFKPPQQVMGPGEEQD